MAKQKYLLVHEGRAFREIDERGRFSTVGSDNVTSRGSDQWLCTGAVHLSRDGQVLETKTLRELFVAPVLWLHRDGSQRWYLTDVDHGTHRIRVSPEHTVQICEREIEEADKKELAGV